MAIQEIKRFFEPESVAVVGASRDPSKFGSVIIQNLQHLGYPGKIFAINRHANEILGVKSFPSTTALEEKVDVVIVAVPANAVPQVMTDCAQRGIRNVIIISSGFSEAGEAGQKTLEETLRIAQQGKIRIIGPNTTGIFNPSSRFTTTFIPLTGKVETGSVAFIAQTGMFAGVMLLYLASAERFGISKVAGLGNKSDVDESDILEYLYEDEDTRVVIAYMEGIKDGRRFLEVARKFTRSKPLIVLKGGRTAAGAKAAASHTGSLAGQYSLIEALFSRTGIILANDMEQMIDSAKILAYQPLPKGPRVGVASMSGGAGVMASDAIIEAGLTLAPVSSQGINYIQTLLPEWAVASHPMDLEPLMEKIGGDEGYKIGMEVLLNDPNVDMCLLVAGVGMFAEDAKNTITTLAPLLLKNEKPVAISLIGQKEQCEILAAQFEEIKVPVYLMVDRATRSLATLHQYATLKLGKNY